jgi:hypothetical protein
MKSSRSKTQLFVRAAQRVTQPSAKNTAKNGGVHLVEPTGEQVKTIEYRFYAAKSTKQGVEGESLRPTHNDYAA